MSDAHARPGARLDLGPFIDHTLLAPDATGADIDRLCDEAIGHRFATVCLNPVWVGQAAERLSGSTVAVCSVVGFPLGATLPEVKAFEVQVVIGHGAAELDAVINIGALRAGDLALVRDDVEGVVSAAHSAGALCKVIIEVGLLERDEKVAALEVAVAAGADFVKTSTGFGNGATVDDVLLMCEIVGPSVGVKAAGGVRTRGDAEAMIAAGATRIGTSAGVGIVTGRSPETTRRGGAG